MAATFAVLGSTFTGVVHWLFGRFIPTFEQLITNKAMGFFIPPTPMDGITPAPLMCLSCAESYPEGISLEHVGKPAEHRK
jgi:hypothetical protein